MTSTFTPNINLQLQGVGDNPNTWGTTLNNNVFTPIDTALGGAYAVTMTNADVTLSAANALNLVFNITGLLTGSHNLIFPAAIGRTLIINNQTTGAYTVTVLSSGGTGVVVPQGLRSTVNIDPSNNTAYIPNGYLSAALAAGNLLIGNGSGNAAAQAVSGAITISTSGSTALGTGVVLGTNIGSAAVTAYNLGTTGVAAGTYAPASIVVNAQGQVTSASQASGGQFITGTYNYNVATANGTATITGLGFTPKQVDFLGNLSSNPWAWFQGLDDGAHPVVMANGAGTNFNPQVVNGYSLYPVLSAGNVAQGKIASFGSGYFTISWTALGTNTGISSIIYSAKG